MKYKYAISSKNYEDFASGRVLYNAYGTTSFPVRLASEIIQRCFSLLEDKGYYGPYSLYDPCCGGGYLLTAIGLLHGERLYKIYASDINPDVLYLAQRNLSLLTPDGLADRKEQLTQLLTSFQKRSHEEALTSLDRLDKLTARLSLEETVVFQNDITAKAKTGTACRGINIVITDLPYGDIVNWRSASSDPVPVFFDQILTRLHPDYSIVAIIADKGQKLQHENFKRLQYFRIGKRQVGIFELNSS